MKRLIHSKWLLPSLFIALVLNGIEFELLGLLSDVPTYQAASALILATSLFGLYLIPFSVVICYLAKRYQMSGFLIAVASLGGIYISGFLASYGNQWVGQFWSHVIPSTSFVSHWNDALTAPIVEEPIKAFAAILVISLFPTISLKEKFVVALLAGMGFQLTEDISYLSQAASKSLDSLLPTALERISGAATSHWVYTAIFTMGLYLLLKGSTTFSRRQKLFWLLSPLVLHFIWDSPLTNFSGLTIILGTLTLLIFINLFQKIDALDSNKRL